MGNLRAHLGAWFGNMGGLLGPKPVRLDIGDRDITFVKTADFEFCLASRVDVPAVKMVDLMKMRTSDLRKEAKNIRRVEKKFTEFLSNTLSGAGTIHQYLGQLDVKIFSQDHEWRSIFRGLLVLGPEGDELKRIALVKYMQYLASRQDVLKHIYFGKKAQEKPDAAESEVEGEPEIEDQPPELRQTSIFNMEESRKPEEPSVATRLERLPRGETVIVRGDGIADIPMGLSTYPFHLVPGDQWRLVDEQGREMSLRPGRNVIGRHDGNEVSVDPDLRSVSRNHLVAEVIDELAIMLTDISSHGTFVASGLIERSSTTAAQR